MTPASMTPGGASMTPGGASMTDWPNHERILARFRQWLDETHAEADTLADDAQLTDGQPDGGSVGLYQLIEQFTALRHEVKLQTKSSRNLDQRSAGAFDALQEAVTQLHSVQTNQAEAVHQAAKPLVEALIDLDEALQRGQAVIETARRRVLEESARELQELRQRLDELFRRQSWWRRRLCRPWNEAIKDVYFPKAIEVHRSILDSLVEGYDLIQKRLQRTLTQEQILRIECVGKPVDPNSMTVIEALDDPYRPGGLVIDQIRPGYYWRGKVFRFAEVRAVRS